MENNLKLLTLIVPSYNMERYLHRCLDSLVVDDDFTMNALDVIVVNDGSKDKTSEIAHSYAEKYPNTFRVIDKLNGNYGSCINAGLKVAQGKYARPLDADDYVVTANLQNIIKTLGEIDADVIITDFTEVTDNCETLRERTFDLLTSNEMFNINDSLCRYELPMHSLSYRTDLLRNMGYQQTEGIFYSDQQWNFLPFKTVKTLYYLPQKLYQYVMGRDGQSVDPVVEQKHMDSNTTVFLSLLQCMSTVDKQSVTYKYMYHYLQRLSIHIYYAVLLAEPYSSDNDKLLREADRKLMLLSPELYDFLDEDTISFNIRLIRRWRQEKATNIRLLKRTIPFYNLILKWRHAFLKKVNKAISKNS